MPSGFRPARYGAIVSGCRSIISISAVKVSVVIPTRDRADLLKRALQSVYAQTRLADEVIVVDDGSSDRTDAMLVSEFPRVRCITQSHAGVSAARNTGIRAARGEWIAFLDSDDEWLADKLELQLKAVCGEATERIWHSDEIWIRHGRRVNPMNKHRKQGGWIFEKCVDLCAISPSAVMIHHSVFEKVGLFDERLPACEDYDLWLRISCCYPVGYIDSPLIRKYGGHPDQLSARYWGMDRFRIQALKKILDQGGLGAGERRYAVDSLVRRAGILAKGARKRGKVQEAEEYDALAGHYDGDGLRS